MPTLSMGYHPRQAEVRQGGAVGVLGDETMKTIARELGDAMKRNVSIDWTMKESVRARRCRSPLVPGRRRLSDDGERGF